MEKCSDFGLGFNQVHRKAKKEGADGKTNSSIKEQASANIQTNWIFDLVVKLKKSSQCIFDKKPPQIHDGMERLFERIRALEKLSSAHEVHNKDNEKYLEGLQYLFSPILTLCNQLIRESESRLLPDVKDLSYDQWADMAKGLFRALDKREDIFSGIVYSETAFINTTLELVEKEQASSKNEANWVFELIVELNIRVKFLDVYQTDHDDDDDDDLEKLTDFISVLEKLSNALKENGKILEGLKSDFHSIMTLCDDLNYKFKHLHDAELGADERLIM